MKPNVRIVVRDRGKIVAVREEHNTWTAAGKQYLAEVISLTSQDPDVPERTDRIEYLGFGMGGAQQNQRSMVTSAPLSAVYPVGSAPHGTSGFTYRDDFIFPVASLELPVAFFADSTADLYTNTTSATWRQTAPTFSDMFHFSVHPSPNVFRFHYTGRSSPLVFSQPISGNQYHLLPLSEAGLYLSSVAVNDDPFASPVAYVTFDTIQISETVDLFLEWDVTF